MVPSQFQERNLQWYLHFAAQQYWDQLQPSSKAQYCSFLPEKACGAPESSYDLSQSLPIQMSRGDRLDKARFPYPWKNTRTAPILKEMLGIRPQYSHVLCKSSTSELIMSS